MAYDHKHFLTFRGLFGVIRTQFAAMWWQEVISSEWQQASISVSLSISKRDKINCHDQRWLVSTVHFHNACFWHALSVGSCTACFWSRWDTFSWNIGVPWLRGSRYPPRFDQKESQESPKDGQSRKMPDHCYRWRRFVFATQQKLRQMPEVRGFHCRRSIWPGLGHHDQTGRNKTGCSAV